jgi:prophage regulatory protein
MQEGRAMWRLKQVVAVIGMSRSSVWQMVKDGYLPAPVRIGARAVAWPSWEICKIIDAQVAGFGPEAIKTLVCRLSEERQICLDASESKGYSPCSNSGSGQ